VLFESGSLALHSNFNLHDEAAFATVIKSPHPTRP
jgi:hypothetical protein